MTETDALISAARDAYVEDDVPLRKYERAVEGILADAPPDWVINRRVRDAFLRGQTVMR